MFKCSNAQMLKCSYFQMFKCSNDQMSCSDFQMFKCQISNVNKVKLLSERTSGSPPVIFFYWTQVTLSLTQSGKQILTQASWKNSLALNQASEFSLNQASGFLLNQAGKDKDYAGNEPSLHGGQRLRLKPEISTVFWSKIMKGKYVLRKKCVETNSEGGFPYHLDITCGEFVWMVL